MASLITYKIPHDYGYAPNPDGEICTLVGCKPQVRKSAQMGDWIAAFAGAPNSLRLIYAMRVTQKMTMEEYDGYCRENLPFKLRKTSDDKGDCVYDFRNLDSSRLPNFHPNTGLSLDKRPRDLGGKYALLSDHFAYFGECAPELPEHLRPIIPFGIGFTKSKNDAFVEPFIRWIENKRFRYISKKPHGKPVGDTKRPQPWAAKKQADKKMRGCAR
jgi:hypothetical protein